MQRSAPTRRQHVIARHLFGRLRFAATTITIADVLAGLLEAADDALVRCYRATLGSWRPIELESRYCGERRETPAVDAATSGGNA
jgi:hypothetical protein